jgi:hypothetical protein
MLGREMPAPVIGGNHWPQAALISVGLGDRRVETTETAIIGMLAFGVMVFKECAFVAGCLIVVHCLLSSRFKILGSSRTRELAKRSVEAMTGAQIVSSIV